MKTYKSHKTVQAAKITNITGEQDGYKRLHFDDEPDKVVPFAWVQKHQPAVGGYFVLYNDGYTSYSPSAPFEEGYTEVAEEDLPADGGEPVAGGAAAAVKGSKKATKKKASKKS